MSRNAPDAMFLFSNPLGWVHGQLSGGWKRAWTVGGFYLVGGSLLLMVIYRAVAAGGGIRNTWNFAGGAMLLLLAIQAGILLLVGSSGVRKAIQRDVTGGMLESHRLTPISGLQAVLGYLTGPNLTLLPITLANWIVAVALALANAHTQEALGWTIGLGVLGCAAFCLWSWSLLSGLCIRRATPVVPILVVTLVSGGYSIIQIIPGLGMLAGFFSIRTMITRATSGSLLPDWTIVMPVIGQVLLGLFAVAGSARRYLRDDVQAFSWPWGLAITAFAAGWGGLGLRLFSTIQPSTGNPLDFNRVPQSAQWVATLTLLTLIACLAPLAAAQMQARWRRRAAFELPGMAAAAPISHVWVACMVAIIAAVILTWSAGGSADAILRHESGWIAHALLESRAPRFMLMLLALAGVALAVLPIAGLARIWYRGREKAIVIVLAWMIATWIGPVMIDVARAVYVDTRTAENWTWITGLSPPGLWALAAHRSDVALLPGVIFQSAAALLLGVMAPAMGARGAARPAAA